MNNLIFIFVLAVSVHSASAGFWDSLFGALDSFAEEMGIPQTVPQSSDPIPNALPVDDEPTTTTTDDKPWWEDLFNSPPAAPVLPVSQPAVLPPSTATGHGATCKLPAGGFGTCQDVLVSTCAGSRLTGLCPGPANVQCCPSSQPVTTPAPFIPSNEPGVGAQCRYTPGVCQDIRVDRCSMARVSNQCPGNANVLCCPSGVPAPQGGDNGPVTTSSGANGCGAYIGLAFPLVSGSLKEISVNWGGSRSGGRRCHAGLDIYTSGARRVQIVADGVVTNIMKGWYPCSGGSIDAIFVYHTTGPLAGKTINYGEMNPGTYTVRVGETVRQGQSLGVASHCGMLHLELYQGRRETNLRWTPKGSVGSGCHRTSLSTLPFGLLDPRPLIRCTAPPNPRFRHGIGFLSEADGELFAADLAEEGEEALNNGGGMSTGAIVVVVAALAVICIASVVMLALYLMRRDRTDTMHEPNQTYMVSAGAAAADDGMQSAVFSGRDMQSGVMSGHDDSGASFVTDRDSGASLAGEFACDQCGKQYAYVDDLIVHTKLRHHALHY